MWSSLSDRQGARFVESWIDGFAFTELSNQQKSVSLQREELEQQRKILTKRKVNMSSSGTGVS